jgi:hypothetical protein
MVLTHGNPINFTGDMVARSVLSRRLQPWNLKVAKA